MIVVMIALPVMSVPYFGCQYLNGEWTWDEEKQGLAED